MKNYAGKEGPELDAALTAELEAAGITVRKLPFTDERREVKTPIIGTLHGWVFRRAWYYWVAEGPGIPHKEATELHELCGHVVRVAGDCSCPTPAYVYKGLGVGLYHVDSEAGLKALADTIRKVVETCCGPIPDEG